MSAYRSGKTKMQTWKHGTEIQSWNLTHLWLCWESAQKVAGKMEKLSHLHKYQQPSALAISEAWQDDRAPDGRVVSGSSRAFTMDWELKQQQWGLLSHQGSVVQIGNGNRDAPQSLKCHPCCWGTAICPRNPFIFLHSGCRQVHYLSLQIQSLGQTIQAVICKWLDITINDNPSASVAVETT